MRKVTQRGQRPRGDSDDDVFAQLCAEETAIGRVWRGLERFRAAGLDCGGGALERLIEDLDGEAAHL